MYAIAGHATSSAQHHAPTDRGLALLALRPLSVAFGSGRDQMTGIAIVTGAPGAGKTTLSRRAAKADSRGLHLPADVFYTFPAYPVSPVLPEAHEQNGAVIAAVTRAAAAFAARGYEVFLDGIVGPSFLPAVAAELAFTRIPIDYVILQVGRDEAIRRATSRLQPGTEVVVRHMHAEFQNLGEYASHAFDTTDMTIDEAFAEFARRRSTGVFALDLARMQAAACRTSR